MSPATIASRPRLSRPRVARLRVSLPAAATLVGGAAVVSGALLPWMTFYAGLQRVPGVSGRYGQLLLVAGLLLVGVGVARMWRDHGSLRALGVIIGLGTLASAALLLSRAVAMTDATASAMLVPRVGPGLFVIAFGGLAALLALAAAPAREGR